MNTNAVISLDTRRPKEDGTCPLIMRLTHHRKTTAIPFGISIHPKDWNEKERIVRSTYKGTDNVKRLNNSLQAQKASAIELIIKLHDAKQLDSLSLTELKERIHQPQNVKSFINFTEQLIEELKKTNRLGTARSYRGLVSVLKTFSKGKDISFNEINYSFLNKFENAHIAKGNSYNGLSVYLRAIRAIYNKAIKYGYVDKQQYPFADYKVRSVPTQKRALDWETLKKIIEFNLPEGHLLFDTRNYFVASYMMYGMNYTDMAFLRKSDICDGRIQYRRRKTSKLYDIKITDSLNTILSYFTSRNEKTGFIFPILRSIEPIKQDKEILWARKRYNKKLKLLAKELGIEQNMTSYVSRHSFATQAMLMQIPLNAISSMLGHSNLKTTEIYLKSLPSSILDDYHEKILGSPT